MRRLFTAVMLGGIILGGSNLSANSIPEHDPHTLIVKFADHIDGKALATRLKHTEMARIALLQSLAASGVESLRPLFSIPPKGLTRQGLYDSLKMGQYFLLNVVEPLTSDAIISNVLGLNTIVSADFNAYQTPLGASEIPDDFWYADSQWNMRMIHMERAWELTTGSNSIGVAVIDDGIAYTHPELYSRIGFNTIEMYGFSDYDDDANGLIDDIWGWDFGDNDNNPHPSFDGSPLCQ